jgi:hypothetical protein
VFPTGSLDFVGGASLRLPPHRYLFAIGRGEYCLGLFDNGGSGTLIGGIAVRNALVTVRARWLAGLHDKHLGWAGTVRRVVQSQQH